MDPFMLFPEEVWEIILHKVEDSRDVRNAFRAFPQLDLNSTLQKKKHLWLFGLVLPHLIPPEFTSAGNEALLLKFRLVCRLWSVGVDKFLESQPKFRAYHTLDDTDPPGSLPWNTKVHLEKEDYGVVRLRYRKHYGGTLISDYDLDDYEDSSLVKFLHDMKDHSPGRNPFLSRSLKLSIPSEFGNDKGKIQTFWKDIHILHERFAEHIWHYSVDFGLNWLDPKFINESFPRLQNLRRLHIDITEENSKPMAFRNTGPLVNLILKRLGPLPYLETLRLKTDNEILGKGLIARYAPQIRILEFQFRSWKLGSNPPMTMGFKNLTELLVDAGNPDHIKALRKFFQKVEAPNLAKLQVDLYTSPWLHFPNDTGSCDFWIEEDVFQWIKRFPKLRYLDFGEECRIVKTMEKGTLSPELDSAPSLQFLAIRTSLEMSYNFLRCLPSLQYLHLYVHSEPVVHDGSPNANKQVVRIREEIQHANMYMSNIWELLPKLKTVTLVKELSVHPERWQKWEFTREGYEFQVMNGFPCNENDVPLRKDIISFLNKRSRKRHGSSSDDEDEDEDGWEGEEDADDDGEENDSDIADDDEDE